MYAELYAAWQRELESPELAVLPSDFYVRVADYLRRIKEENRMLDKKTVKAALLDREAKNAKRLARELVKMRYKKLVRLVALGQKVAPEVLTEEEAKLCAGVLPLADAYQKFAGALLQGQLLKINIDVEKAHTRTILRFTKEIPAIVGVDMKNYGPFVVEDVASLPIENAKILVKQGLAKMVETSQ